MSNIPNPAQGWIAMDQNQIDNLTRIVRTTSIIKTIFDNYHSGISDSNVRVSLRVLDKDIQVPDYIEKSVQSLLNQLNSTTARALTQLFSYGFYVVMPTQVTNLDEESITIRSSVAYQETIDNMVDVLNDFSTNIQDPGMKKIKRVKASKTIEDIFKQSSQNSSSVSISVIPVEKLMIYKRYNTKTFNYEFEVFLRPTMANGINDVFIKLPDAIVFFDFECVDSNDGFISSPLMDVMPSLVMYSILESAYAIGASRRSTQAVAEESPAPDYVNAKESYRDQNDNNDTIETRRLQDVQRNIDNMKHSLTVFNETMKNYEKNGIVNSDWHRMAELTNLSAFNPLIKTLTKAFPLQAPPYPVPPGSHLVPINFPEPDPHLYEHMNVCMAMIASRFCLSLSWLQGKQSTGPNDRSGSTDATDGQMENTRKFTRQYTQLLEAHLKKLTEIFHKTELTQLYSMLGNFLEQKMPEDQFKKSVREILKTQSTLVITLIGRSSPKITLADLLLMHDNNMISRENRDAQAFQKFNLNPQFLMNEQTIIEELETEKRILKRKLELTVMQNEATMTNPESKAIEAKPKKQKKEEDKEKDKD